MRVGLPDWAPETMGRRHLRWISLIPAGWVEVRLGLVETSTQTIDQG